MLQDAPATDPPVPDAWMRQEKGRANGPALNPVITL
jgi:hypothetical protein